MLCDECKEKKANRFCDNCEIFFCYKCGTANTPGHQLSPLLEASGSDSSDDTIEAFQETECHLAMPVGSNQNIKNLEGVKTTSTDTMFSQVDGKLSMFGASQSILLTFLQNPQSQDVELANLEKLQMQVIVFLL